MIGDWNLSDKNIRVYDYVKMVGSQVKNESENNWSFENFQVRLKEIIL